MFNHEAIEALQESEAITAANNALSGSDDSFHVVALPSDFQEHDLEKYLPNRRRARGTMTTPSLSSFAGYTKEHADENATVFIDADELKAVAVLNMGMPSAPGHTDNRAVLAPRATAAYMALKAITGHGRSQKDVAEFLEDWAGHIECFRENESVAPNKAIAAIRSVTIEAMRKLENAEQQLSASRSTFESVSATSTQPLPTHIYFKCQPYADLSERNFVLRLGVLTASDKPSIVLRIVKKEEHDEEMAQELATKVRQAIAGDGDEIAVVIGSYTAGR